jgi:DGQHR domain-containing protein
MSIDYKKEGNKFHREIEQMLRRSGADIIKSDPNAKGSDIILKLDDNKIIVQCKYSPEGKKIQNLDNLIDSYSRKIQKQKAKAAILALGNYQVPENYIKNRGKIIRKDKVALWTDKTIQSYKNLVKSIGKYVKYQIIGDLGIHSGIKTFAVDAIPVDQQKHSFFLAKLNPSFLLKACYVARRVEDPKTYQRYITKKRVVEQIPDYIKSDLGIFPNSVILVADYPLKYKSKLHLRDCASSLWILDGQHRIYAFANIFSQDILDNYEIVCSIFDGKNKKMDHNSQAKLFIKINDEAKKVPPSLITDLAASFDNIDFHRRQINIYQRLNKMVMFKDRFKTYQSTKGVLNPTTFCTNQSMIRLTRERNGLIFKTSQTLTDKKEEDRALSYLSDYFKIISRVFKKEWKFSNKYILSTDRGIRGLLNLYEKILRYTRHRNDTKKIEVVLQTLKKTKPELRLSELKNQYLGEGGARDMADNFSKKICEIIPSFDPSLENIKIQGKVIDSITIYNRGDYGKAKEFVYKAFENYFDGKAFGELMHIDKSTFNYIEKLSEKCKTIQICFQDIKSDEKKKCGELLKKLREKNINIILTKKKVHERWLATDKYLLLLNTDLKDDAIASKKHSKQLQEINKNTEIIINFKRDWEFYEKMAGDSPMYNYDPLGENSS